MQPDDGTVQCQAEKDLFEIRTSILCVGTFQHYYNMSGVQPHNLGTLSIFHVRCKYSMALSSTTPLNKCKHAEKGNASQCQARSGGMHLRSSQINEIKVLNRSTNAMSIPNSTVGLWQPGNRVVGTVGVLHVSCGGACLG